MKHLALLTHLLPAVFGQTATDYVVINSCPAPINLYVNGAYDSYIPTGGKITKSLLHTAEFYSDINGGSATGAATRAFINRDVAQGYYYIVKDTAHFNTGLGISVLGPQRAGFCGYDECNDVGCTNAYSQPPTTFPAPNGTLPPTPPLFSCGVTGVTFFVTFCPSGKFPAAGPQTFRVHPSSNPKKCLDVREAVFANGTPVQIFNCNGTPAQSWELQRESTKVRLAGTQFCLDAGSSPVNGVGMKIWKCYDNLPAQQWYYTDDNRIALENQGQCLDLTNGNLTNGNQIQTWKCTNGNQNQVWTI